ADTYHGTKIDDPYRWLEEGSNQDTRSWIESQNRVTRKYLDDIKVREAINKRLEKLWDYEKFSTPFKEGGRVFFFKNTGLQNQDVLFVKDDKEDATARELLDPNKLSADGTVALSGVAVSDDGKLLAYSVSESGSDWQEWRVRDIDTGNDLKDRLRWAKFSSASWTTDNQGFFYSKYDEPKAEDKFEGRNYFQKLYYHKLGEDQARDKLIYERKDEKEWGFDGTVTEDGKYLIIHVWKGTEPKNRIFVKALGSTDAEVMELLEKADAKYHFVGNEGSKLWFRTDLSAPRGRLIAIDLDKSKAHEPSISEVIPESKDTLEEVTLVGDHFFLQYLKDAFTSVAEHTTSGEFIRNVELPGIGTASGFNGKKADKETYFSYTSFNCPSTSYKYTVADGKKRLVFKPKVAFDPENFEIKQVFVKSKDGTKVPLFIVSKKGLELKGDTPTYLYGYGGFNISLVPSFSITMVEWMEMGGIYAQACLRGGGEYGEDWHQQGMKDKKQNVFDDFIACGEWLIENKYTNRSRLAIAGGSNGGLLVGACMTQRPDLFAAACPTVGVLDMLRFHKFTIGWGWTSDYGCADNEKEFKTLLAYSPLHNIKSDTSYPATLIITGDHDDRVVPAHSFKFAASLQEKHKGDAPVLIRIETKAGHGAGKPTSKLIAEWTDKLAFLVRTLNFEEAAEKALNEPN
ncbi:MAG: prolyl oligopeptidase family serine peptidase, partial [Cyanobacteria bacterium]|nr:prolyl oligopeptidase family serine peptidase [Cyanobacteriota bacterium]